MIDSDHCDFDAIDDNPSCPDCQSDTVMRSGPYGFFFGCINYRSGCKGKVTVNSMGELVSANTEMRSLYANVYQALSRLWKSGKMTEEDAFALVSAKIKTTLITHLSKDECKDLLLDIDILLNGNSRSRRILKGMWDD